MLASFLLLAQADTFRLPTYLVPVFLILMAGGALGWLVASVLGFARARAFGSSTRWFAFSSICLLLYHLQWIAFVIYGSRETDVERVLGLGAFFNLFVVIGAICAIIGFASLTNPRP